MVCLCTACGKKPDNTVILPYYNTPDFTPHWLHSHDSVEREITHTIGNFSFTDQNGNRISLPFVKGKIHVANFFYTTCTGICPLMNGHMEILQDSFLQDPEVLLLSFSVMPETDTTEALKAYAAQHHVQDHKWHLLTGDRDSIYRLARQSYFAEEKTGYLRDSTRFLHTEHLILVDPDLHIRGIYNGTVALETQRLIQDIHALEKEFPQQAGE